MKTKKQIFSKTVVLFALCLSFSLTSTTLLAGAPKSSTAEKLRHKAVPFYRYLLVGHDHFYTLDWKEVGTKTPGHTGKSGYVSEGVAGHIFRTKQRGTVPLYRYWNGRDHFYTPDWKEIGTKRHGMKGKKGYTSEGIAGYVFPTKQRGTVPLYRYWNGNDHFYTTNSHEIGTDAVGVKGKHNHTCQGIVGYIYK